MARKLKVVLAGGSVLGRQEENIEIQEPQDIRRIAEEEANDRVVESEDWLIGENHGAIPVGGIIGESIDWLIGENHKTIPVKGVVGKSIDHEKKYIWDEFGKVWDKFEKADKKQNKLREEIGRDAETCFRKAINDSLKPAYDCLTGEIQRAASKISEMQKLVGKSEGCQRTVESIQTAMRKESAGVSANLQKIQSDVKGFVAQQWDLLKKEREQREQWMAGQKAEIQKQEAGLQDMRKAFEEQIASTRAHEEALTKTLESIKDDLECVRRQLSEEISARENAEAELERAKAELQKKLDSQANDIQTRDKAQKNALSQVQRELEDCLKIQESESRNRDATLADALAEAKESLEKRMAAQDADLRSLDSAQTAALAKAKRDWKNRVETQGAEILSRNVALSEALVKTRSEIEKNLEEQAAKAQSRILDQAEALTAATSELTSRMDSQIPRPKRWFRWLFQK